MPRFLQRIHWKCDSCKLSGIAIADEKTSIACLVSSIQIDHSERSPRCTTGDNEIRVGPEKASRQWLSSCSA
jgi:hypothetical protein